MADGIKLTACSAPSRTIADVTVRAHSVAEHGRGAGVTAGAPLHGGELRPDAGVLVDHGGDLPQSIMGVVRLGAVLSVRKRSVAWSGRAGTGAGRR